MAWYLETQRLRLRPIDRTDAFNLSDLNRDPRVMAYLPPEWESLAEWQVVLPKIVASNERYDNQLGLFAAFEKETEDFIGRFILRPDRQAPDDTANLELGYRLKQRYWGRGIATEGSRALVAYARENFRARRIYATAMVGNRASIRVMEKIGLSFEKTFSRTDEFGKAFEFVMYSCEDPASDDCLPSTG